MEIEGKYIIASSRELVWEALNDPEILRECIPGCESFTKTGDNAFDAHVLASIGPVKARFRTTVTLENINAPESYTIVGSSKGGGAGFGKGTADVTLVVVETGTELSYRADFKVGGKLAQVGSRLVTGATKKTADDFFGNFSARLDPGARKIEEVPPTGRRVNAWIIVAWVAAAALVGWLWLR